MHACLISIPLYIPKSKRSTHEKHVAHVHRAHVRVTITSSTEYLAKCTVRAKNQLKKNRRLPDVYGGGVWTTATGGAVSPATASCVVWRPVTAPGVDAAKRLGIGQRARVLRLWRAKQQYAQHSVRRIPGTIKINAKADEIPDNKSETTVSMNINVTNSG